MNPTSHAIFQTMLATDTSLSAAERRGIQRLLNGETEDSCGTRGDLADRLLITQKKAAEMLSVSRVTIWRMTKDGALHPTEILPGTWRYSYQEIAAIAGKKCQPPFAAKLSAA
jgi:hypothetical protein